jgi:Fe2+ or Zn2+ uptake regulation protein
LSIHDDVAARLRRVGQRYTPARRTLVDALAAADGPLSVVTLQAAAPSLPQSSVYRNLADLEQAGAVARVSGPDDFSRYELAEDLAGHHHHLVCTGCGQVLDFHLSAAAERAMNRAAADAAASAGFSAVAHRLDLLGLCGACA